MEARKRYFKGFVNKSGSIKLDKKQKENLEELEEEFYKSFPKFLNFKRQEYGKEIIINPREAIKDTLNLLKKPKPKIILEPTDKLKEMMKKDEKRPYKNIIKQLKFQIEFDERRFLTTLQILDDDLKLLEFHKNRLKEEENR